MAKISGLSISFPFPVVLNKSPCSLAVCITDTRFGIPFSNDCYRSPGIEHTTIIHSEGRKSKGTKTQTKVRTSGWCYGEQQENNESADMKEGDRRPSAQRWRKGGWW